MRVRLSEREPALLVGRHAAAQCEAYDARVELSEAQRAAIAFVEGNARGGPIDPAWRVTVHFHPDRDHLGTPILDAIARDRVYRSQFETGTSNGGLTAHEGGARWTWEHRMFGGAYDDAPLDARPKYGGLDFRGTGYGASPRFGSAFFRLRAETIARTTFCHPDSVFEPVDFGTASRMALVELALRRTSTVATAVTSDATNELATATSDETKELDALDDYIEAHVHGPLRIEEDVEALVLDPCFASTDVERRVRRLGCAIEWHAGFRLARDRIGEVEAYRGTEVAALLHTLVRDGAVTAREIGELARSGAHDPQHVKKAWHGVARFGR